MRKAFLVSIAAVGLAVLTSPTAFSADLHGKGYETGELTCGSTTYTVLATGFGSAFRVQNIGSSSVLVFHSGTLTNVDTGESVTFVANGNPKGFVPVRCTGVLVNPVFSTTYNVVFFMTVAPS